MAALFAHPGQQQQQQPVQGQAPQHGGHPHPAQGLGHPHAVAVQMQMAHQMQQHHHPQQHMPMQVAMQGQPPPQGPSLHGHHQQAHLQGQPSQYLHHHAHLQQQQQQQQHLYALQGAQQGQRLQTPQQLYSATHPAAAALYPAAHHTPQSSDPVSASSAAAGSSNPLASQQHAQLAQAPPGHMQQIQQQQQQHRQHQHNLQQQHHLQQQQQQHAGPTPGPSELHLHHQQQQHPQPGSVAYTNAFAGQAAKQQLPQQQQQQPQHLQQQFRGPSVTATNGPSALAGRPSLGSGQEAQQPVPRTPNVATASINLNPSNQPAQGVPQASTSGARGLPDGAGPPTFPQNQQQQLQFSRQQQYPPQPQQLLPLPSAGDAVSTPKIDDRRLFHAYIYDYLYRQGFADAARAFLIDVPETPVKKDAQGQGGQSGTSESQADSKGKKREIGDSAATSDEHIRHGQSQTQGRRSPGGSLVPSENNADSKRRVTRSSAGMSMHTSAGDNETADARRQQTQVARKQKPGTSGSDDSAHSSNTVHSVSNNTLMSKDGSSAAHTSATSNTGQNGDANFTSPTSSSSDGFRNNNTNLKTTTSSPKTPTNGQYPPNLSSPSLKLFSSDPSLQQILSRPLPPPEVNMNAPQGFLFEFWSIFWDCYRGKNGFQPATAAARTFMQVAEAGNYPTLNGELVRHPSLAGHHPAFVGAMSVAGNLYGASGPVQHIAGLPEPSRQGQEEMQQQQQALGQAGGIAPNAQQYHAQPPGMSVPHPKVEGLSPGARPGSGNSAELAARPHSSQGQMQQVYPPGQMPVREREQMLATNTAGLTPQQQEQLRARSASQSVPPQHGQGLAQMNMQAAAAQQQQQQQQQSQGHPANASQAALQHTHNGPPQNLAQQPGQSQFPQQPQPGVSQGTAGGGPQQQQQSGPQGTNARGPLGPASAHRRFAIAPTEHPGPPGSNMPGTQNGQQPGMQYRGPMQPGQGQPPMQHGPAQTPTPGPMQQQAGNPHVRVVSSPLPSQQLPPQAGPPGSANQQQQLQMQMQMQMQGYRPGAGAGPPGQNPHLQAGGFPSGGNAQLHPMQQHIVGGRPMPNQQSQQSPVLNAQQQLYATANGPNGQMRSMQPGMQPARPPSVPPNPAGALAARNRPPSVAGHVAENAGSPLNVMQRAPSRAAASSPFAQPANAGTPRMSSQLVQQGSQYGGSGTNGTGQPGQTPSAMSEDGHSPVRRAGLSPEGQEQLNARIAQSQARGQQQQTNAGVAAYRASLAESVRQRQMSFGAAGSPAAGEGGSGQQQQQGQTAQQMMQAHQAQMYAMHQQQAIAHAQNGNGPSQQGPGQVQVQPLFRQPNQPQPQQYQAMQSSNGINYSSPTSGLENGMTPSSSSLYPPGSNQQTGGEDGNSPGQQANASSTAASPHPSLDSNSVPLSQIQEALARHPSNARQQQQAASTSQTNGSMPPPRKPTANTTSNVNAAGGGGQSLPVRAPTPASQAATPQHQGSPVAASPAPHTPRTPSLQLATTAGNAAASAAQGGGGSGGSTAKGRKRTATDAAAVAKETKKKPRNSKAAATQAAAASAAAAAAAKKDSTDVEVPEDISVSQTPQGSEMDTTASSQGGTGGMPPSRMNSMDLSSFANTGTGIPALPQLPNSSTTAPSSSSLPMQTSTSGGSSIAVPLSSSAANHAQQLGGISQDLLASLGSVSDNGQGGFNLDDLPNWQLGDVTAAQIFSVATAAGGSGMDPADFNFDDFLTSWADGE